jgi:hypothetical protein
MGFGSAEKKTRTEPKGKGTKTRMKTMISMGDIDHRMNRRKETAAPSFL